MKRFSTLLLALVALAGTAFGEVKDGEVYSSGGDTVHVSIVNYPSFNTVGVTYGSGGMAIGPFTGTPGPGNSTASPTADAAPAGTVNGTSFRVHSGQMQKKNSSGAWVSMGRPRKKGTRAPKVPSSTDTPHLGGDPPPPGDGVTTLPEGPAVDPRRGPAPTSTTQWGGLSTGPLG